MNKFSWWISLRHFLISGIAGYIYASGLGLDEREKILMALFAGLGGSANDLVTFNRNKERK